MNNKISLSIKWDLKQPKWFKFKLKPWFYKNIRNRLFPRQKWLFDKIGRDWKDKVTIIPLVLFECIVHYVEVEEALKVIDWDSWDDHKKVKKEIEEIYSWIKNDYPALIKKQDDDLDAWFEYSKWKNKDVDPVKEQELLKQTDISEEALATAVDDMCIRIIKIRRYLWT